MMNPSMQMMIVRHQLLQSKLSLCQSLSLGMVRSQLITNEEQESESGVASQEDLENEDDDV
jgi:hypothetical protein